MSIDDVFNRKASRSERRQQQRRKKQRRRRLLVIVLAVLLVVGVSGVVAVTTARSVFSDLFLSAKDYEGEGTGEVIVTIPPGSSATQVANMLVEKGVIQSAKPFLDELEARKVVVQAGTFSLRNQMSSASAVDVLEKAEAARRLTVAEGHTIKTIKANAVKAGLKQSDVDQAIDGKTPKDYGLDVDAPSLEGYLYPATYDVDPTAPAADLVKRMVDQTKLELNKLAIPNDDAHYYLTLASLVQVESTADPDVMAKVARTFVNRIGKNSQTGGKLQSDATVAYIFGAREDLTTTEEERNSDNPYNTYKFTGFPPGPINSPGEPAIRASVNPAEGDWQYFVATNPDTGEVKFANNYQDHLKNVEEFRQWLKANSDSSGSDG